MKTYYANITKTNPLIGTRAVKPKQIAAPKRLSTATGAPMAHFMRLGIDQFMTCESKRLGT
jgi:hypothetical protein